MRTGWFVGIAAVAWMAASPARAQFGTGRVMDLDPSVISAGMGGASTAVFWNGEPNVWANPALLGYHQGVRWQWGETQLVPGLVSDVRFSHTRLTLAAYGIGVENAGDPSDAGGIELEYGASVAMDINGNPIGTFDSFESVDATGFGISIGRLIQAIALARDADPPAILQNLDLAFGWARKNTIVALAPGSSFGVAEASSRDRGLLLRAGGATGPLDFGDGAVLSGNLAYGYSVLNYDDAEFVFLDQDFASPPTRHTRHGLAMRLAVEHGEGGWSADDGLSGLLLSGLDPWLSWGFAYDRVRFTRGDAGEGVHQDLVGMEITLANVLSLRGGRVGDHEGDFHHGTWGIGIQVPIGDLAGFRYDYANYPQPGQDEDLQRRAYAVWLDPLAVLRAVR